MFFLEIVLALKFDPDALEILQGKKNIRLLKTSISGKKAEMQRLVLVKRGLLVQEADSKALTCDDLRGYRTIII